jgi:ATP-binding protein involved in chromosome partitioning
MSPTRAAIDAALATVIDPEIRRPITELGMVEAVEIDAGQVTVRVLLTVATCPLRDRIVTDVTNAVSAVAGVEAVTVDLGVMSDDQRQEMATRLRGGAPTRDVPFARPESLTRVYAVASGKGGVGKSSITVNLAAA